MNLRGRVLEKKKSNRSTGGGAVARGSEWPREIFSIFTHGSRRRITGRSFFCFSIYSAYQRGSFLRKLCVTARDLCPPRGARAEWETLLAVIIERFYRIASNGDSSARRGVEQCAINSLIGCALLLCRRLAIKAGRKASYRRIWDLDRSCASCDVPPVAGKLALSCDWSDSKAHALRIFDSGVRFARRPVGGVVRGLAIGPRGATVPAPTTTRVPGSLQRSVRLSGSDSGTVASENTSARK